MHRLNFWIICGIILAIVVTAAVSGGAVAGKSRSASRGSKISDPPQMDGNLTNPTDNPLYECT